jgi:cbb3-type cytochrome oxidase subunit 3
MLVVIGLIIVCLIMLFWKTKKTNPEIGSIGILDLDDDVETEDGEETNEEDEEELREPEVIEMGKCAAYPMCPHCDQEIKKVLILWNNKESEDYTANSLYFAVCPNCKRPLGCNFD